jgi:hypothetical protein
MSAVEGKAEVTRADGDFRFLTRSRQARRLDVPWRSLSKEVFLGDKGVLAGSVRHEAA